MGRISFSAWKCRKVTQFHKKLWKVTQFRWFTIDILITIINLVDMTRMLEEEHQNKVVWHEVATLLTVSRMYKVDNQNKVLPITLKTRSESLPCRFFDRQWTCYTLWKTLPVLIHDCNSLYLYYAAGGVFLQKQRKTNLKPPSCLEIHLYRVVFTIWSLLNWTDKHHRQTASREPWSPNKVKLLQQTQGLILST